jgi:DNA-binding CsgD family transcriptional regulator
MTSVQLTKRDTAIRLTKREVEVLSLATTGLTSREMAAQLFVSKRTIDFHLRTAYAKLNVHTKVAAINRATDLGLIGGRHAI